MLSFQKPVLEMDKWQSKQLRVLLAEIKTSETILPQPTQSGADFSSDSEELVNDSAAAIAMSTDDLAFNVLDPKERYSLLNEMYCTCSYKLQDFRYQYYSLEVRGVQLPGVENFDSLLWHRRHLTWRFAHWLFNSVSV